MSVETLVAHMSAGFTNQAQPHDGGPQHPVFEPTLEVPTQRRLAHAHDRLAPEAPKSSWISTRCDTVGQHMHGGVMFGDDAPTVAVDTCLGKPVPGGEQRATGEIDLGNVLISQPLRAFGKEGVERGQSPQHPGPVARARASSIVARDACQPFRHDHHIVRLPLKLHVGIGAVGERK